MGTKGRTQNMGMSGEHTDKAGKRGENREDGGGGGGSSDLVPVDRTEVRCLDGVGAECLRQRAVLRYQGHQLL